MKRLALAASIMGAILGASPGTAQQKLGDVAGSIKLKKSGSESVVIDSSDVSQQSARGGSSSGLGLLYDVVADCLDASRSLEKMVDNSPRIRPVRYSEDWKTGLSSIGERLDALDLELQRQPDAGAAEAAYLEAVDGFDQVLQGYQNVVAATESRRLLTSAEIRAVRAGADSIEAAMSDLRSVTRSQAASAPPPPIDPIAAAASIRSLCTRYGAEGSKPYADCVEEQDAAKNALIGRTGPAVGVDTSTFNTIRNGCLYEWPDNYVNRNACEVRRAAKASGS
jgi:hypothetical protein